MNPIHFALVVTTSKHAAEKETTLEGRIVAAMRDARSHFMVTDEETRFAGAVGAVYELSNDEDKARIAAELAALHELSNVLNGVQPAADAILAVKEQCAHPIGLIKYWNELGPRLA